LGAKPVCPLNSLDVKRIRPGMRDIDVVQRDPKQAGRKLPHQLPRDVDGELIWAGKIARVIRKLGDRELQYFGHLAQFHFTAAEFRRIERRFVVIAKQMLILRFTSRRKRRGEQTLGKNYTSPQTLSVQPVPALANPIESVAGSNDPGIRCRPLQILAEVFENRGMIRRDRRKVVEGFVNACRETRGGNVMAENAAIDDLCKEGGLRNQLVQKVRNVFLPFRHKGFFIASTSAESYDYGLLRAR